MRGEVVELDRQGRATVLTGAGVQAFNSVRLSPDGRQLALVTTGRRSTVEVYDLARGTVHTLPTPGWELWTLWSPDGREVVAGAGVSDSTYLVGIQADGAGKPRPLSRPWKVTHSVLEALPTSPAFWSTNDSTLYALRAPEGLFAVRMSDGSVRRVAGLSDAMYPALSPDGRWIAYSAQEPGDSVRNVYLQPWPALDRKWKVSRNGGIELAWTQNGRELVYVQGSAGRDSTGNYGIQMMAVDVSPGADPAPGVPHLLFTTRGYQTGPLPDFSVSADGSRFFMIRDLPVRARAGRMYVMTDWFAQLRRLSAEQEAGG
jgi:Tol biopolymer transport system component